MWGGGSNGMDPFDIPALSSEELLLHGVEKREFSPMVEELESLRTAYCGIFLGVCDVG